ncbi:hypothetical protein EDB85DRAFT_2151658 [Lactarius pseudohatsudake]|nr:hypothetical protein EDB85DRAFT_2151658 [Lactarius pseudohatsudake]
MSRRTQTRGDVLGVGRATAHPTRPAPPPLHETEHVSIISRGNVALGVARMLLTPLATLAKYDVPRPCSTSSPHFYHQPAWALKPAFAKERRELTPLDSSTKVTRSSIDDSGRAAPSSGRIITWFATVSKLVRALPQIHKTLPAMITAAATTRRRRKDGHSGDAKTATAATQRRPRRQRREDNHDGGGIDDDHDGGDAGDSGSDEGDGGESYGDDIR